MKTADEIIRKHYGDDYHGIAYGVNPRHLAMVIEEYHSQFKPVTVTDEEIWHYILCEKSYERDAQYAGLEMAKWMRDKLTNQ